MSIARKPISEFKKMTINARWPSDTEIARNNLQPNTLVFRNLETGEIVAQMDAEDLFDVDGNRFWLDA